MAANDSFSNNESTNAISPSFATFVSNIPTKPRIILMCDNTVELGLVELHNTMGHRVQYVGKLPKECHKLDINGFKYVKDETGHPVSDFNGQYTNYQRIFVFPYDHLNGSMEEILIQAGTTFKKVNTLYKHF
jgi:hypothetical protein